MVQKERERFVSTYTYIHLESGLQKYRRKALPPIRTDHKFIISDDYKQTCSNGQFRLYDKRKSAYRRRLILFSSEEQFKVLLQLDVLFADGTCKVAPKLFEQLHVIHGFQNGEDRLVFFFGDSTYLSMCDRTEINSKSNSFVQL